MTQRVFLHTAHLLFLGILIVGFYDLPAQTTIQGSVVDSKDQPVFAANVFSKSFKTRGAITGLNGSFSIQLEKLPDTLICSFLGFEKQEIPIAKNRDNPPLRIVLKEAQQSLSEIIIASKDPVMEAFAVAKLDKMDIYLNPVSQGDALKAITALPYSTTTDESANPSLRGSAGSRSRVLFNGVPIYRPVRNSQINGIGNFSIFNTELVDKMYVFASNPPLVYGNSSAGLIAIETIKKQPKKQSQIAASLAGTGLFLTRPSGKNSFVQGFANLQFSDAFLALNPKGTEQLNQFGSKDIGLNMHSKLGKKTDFNAFFYGISEKYDVNLALYAYESQALAHQKRHYSVLNFKHQLKRGVLSLNLGGDFINRNFEYGNIASNAKIRQGYGALDLICFLDKNTKIQTGFAYDFSKHKSKNRVPEFFYALEPSAPTFTSKNNISNTLPEPYFYIKKEMGAWGISAGLRSDLGFAAEAPYLSGQLAARYALSKNQSLLLSAGRYHSYTVPNFYSTTFQQLQSHVVALDYEASGSFWKIQAAAYAKTEHGGQTADGLFPIDKSETFGVEAMAEVDFLKYFKFNVSNTYIRQNNWIYETKTTGDFDFRYFLKSALAFSHPKIGSITLSYAGRPGSTYNPILSGVYNADLELFAPVFSERLYNHRFADYHRVDLAVSRYVPLQKSSVVFFCSLSNLFDAKNESGFAYSTDFSMAQAAYYTRRMVYFGGVLIL